MIDESKFKEWLKDVKCYKKSTIASRLTNIKKIVEYYPNIEDEYLKDECQSLLNQFTYTQADFEAGDKPSHIIPIKSEKPWEGTATYKNSLILFIEFKNFEVDEIIYEDIEEISSTENNDILSKLKNVFANFKYTKKEYENNIDVLQLRILDSLKIKFEEFIWKEEYKPSNKFKDRIDIYGESQASKYKIVIELDANRADQVAKKFLSRTVLLKDCHVIYVSLCYMGTPRMNKIECSKYFEFCEGLSQMLNNDTCEKLYLGIFLDRKMS